VAVVFSVLRVDHFQNEIERVEVRASFELGPDLSLDQNLLVSGRQGIGKTLAVTRLAFKAVSSGSLCLLVKCTRYQRDFARLLHSAVAPYSACSMSELLPAAKVRASSILLILDGIDQVNNRFREDLLEASAAFF
jgi:hypothetical protein